jgi:hypothetical protein
VELAIRFFRLECYRYNSVRTSTDFVRHLQPSSSYNRRGDPTESALRALPFAALLGPILEFTFSQQRCVNSWILAQYGISRQEVECVPELDWLQMLLARDCPLDAFTYLDAFPRNSSSSLSDAKLTTTSLDSELFRQLRGRQIVTEMGFSSIAERCAIHCNVPQIVSCSAFG